MFLPDSYSYSEIEPQKYKKQRYFQIIFRVIKLPFQQELIAHITNDRLSLIESVSVFSRIINIFEVVVLYIPRRPIGRNVNDKSFKMKKISIISGGSSGLGFQIAGLLKNSGRMVLILGRDKSKLENATLALNQSLSENPALSYGM